MSSTPVVRDQAFPDRPVRIIDPFGAGGGVDVIARALARRLAGVWGQPAIVENHPGAGSTAACQGGHDVFPVERGVESHAASGPEALTVPVLVMVP